MRRRTFIQILRAVVNLLSRYDRGRRERWVTAFVEYRVRASGMVVNRILRWNVRIIGRCLIALGSDVVVL